MCPLVGYASANGWHCPCAYMKAWVGLSEHFTKMKKAWSWEHTAWGSLGIVGREDEYDQYVWMCLHVYVYMHIYTYACIVSV